MECCKENKLKYKANRGNGKVGIPKNNSESI